MADYFEPPVVRLAAELFEYNVQMAEYSERQPVSSDNPYAHVRSKSKDDLYLYWLCEDGEFYKELRGVNAMPTSSERSLKAYEQSWESLKAKYHISEDELIWISSELHRQIPYDLPFKIIKAPADDDDGDLIISIARGTKQSEYEAAWDFIKDYVVSHDGPPDKERKTRNRPNEDPRLIYAIAKARYSGLTFPEIFKRYEKGELECYEDGPTNQFSSHFLLERYFDRHKADR